MALRARENMPAVRASWRSGLAALSRRRSVGYTAYGVLTLVQNSDTILIGWLGGAQAAGQFNLIWRIPTLIIQVLWRIPAYLEPYIIEAHAQGNSAQLRRWYVRGEPWVLMLAGSAAVAFGLWGRPILELWVGEHAPVETWVCWAAAGGAFWLAAARWPIGFIHAQARLRPLVRLLLAETGTRILLTILLFGYVGYAAPLLALNLVMALGLFWGYRQLVSLDG
jgi:O-antigen/teichoic acid export membrane protein